MLPYALFIFCVLSVIAISKLVKNPVYPNFGLAIITLILIVFAGCRYEVGVDYPIYYQFANEAIIGRILRFEPFNQLIFYLSIFLDSPFICFLIYAIIIYIFIYKGCVENSQRPYLSIFLYICLFYLESLGYLRQAAAISVGFYAFKYVRLKLFKKYCLWVGIAMMFHLSAIILLSIYFIYWRIRLKYALLLAGASLALKNLFFLILDKLNFYAGYADMAIEGGGKLKFLYPLILSFIALLHWNMNREDERLYTICFIALPFPFIFPPHTGMRIGNYFFACICFLIPQLFQNSSYKKRLLLSAITTMVFFTYLFVSVRYIPYTLYWNK